MQIMKRELADLAPRLEITKKEWQVQGKNRTPRKGKLSRLEAMVESDSVLSLFEFANGNQAVASASIGQVYKARIRKCPALEIAIGKKAAQEWGGKVVAIKVQRPDVEASASLDMYLLRRTAMWLSKVRGGDLPQVADAFGMQLFGELDYIREANNCERFRALYGEWDDIRVPAACSAFTRRRVMVMDWIDGVKGPWSDQDGIDMVRTGLRCSVDQFMTLVSQWCHLASTSRAQSETFGYLVLGSKSTAHNALKHGGKDEEPSGKKRKEGSVPLIDYGAGKKTRFQDREVSEVPKG
jgi:hypothetical protein